MITKIYSIFDSKAESWWKPMFVPKEGMMIRGFIDMANDKEHAVGQHPEDYALYEIGTWDDDEGVLKQNDKPLSLGMALHFVKKITPFNKNEEAPG